MKLSIITINLNNKVGLQKTIDSVITQTYKDFEWIIIDGGSTDGSKELIEENANHISYWVSEPDNGIFNAMNKGIQISHGEYLLFLNSGDYLYDTGVISKAILLMQDKDFYVGREVHGHTIRECNVSSKESLVYWALRFLPHQSTFIKKDVFEQYGFYREDLMICGDWFLFYKSIVFGNACAGNLPFIVSVFDESGISAKNREKTIEERASILKRNPGIYILTKFYTENFEKIDALNNSKWFLFFFRIGFYFYRKMR